MVEAEKISVDALRDKIAGGWAGKMIGVSYGAPTEFRYRGVINEDPIRWEPKMVEQGLRDDDLYVQISFMMAMDEYGIDAPAEKFAESFANAGSMLWHANRKARKNFWDGIMPPMSGHPDYNLHADDIDFQIEADYIGFMCPGMPQTSNKICDKIGHIMNYGDGVYGGMFVSSLYTAAYFEDDIDTVVKKALKSIPARSQYAQCVQDAIDGHERNPDDWRKTWHELEEKWGEVDICGALDPFNIDAKINGAYVVIGLLYGEGDFEKTMEISTRCGQDSDCNPSNAAGVWGVLNGYEKIPVKFRKHIPEISGSTFIYTNYTFDKAVDRTLDHAKNLIVENGGKIVGDAAYVKIQQPKEAEFEQSFPDMKAKYRTTVEDEEHWKWKGEWRDESFSEFRLTETQKVAEQKGSEMTFSFDGVGALVMGRWDKDCGRADVYVDGEFVREIDCYYYVHGRGAGAGGANGAHLFHVINLEPGDHTIRLFLNGKRNEKSEGTRIRISRAVVYT